jgi:amino acid adenylation domain-containing protein
MLPSPKKVERKLMAIESEDNFTPFAKKEVEGSVGERFEKLVCMYPDRIAVKTSQRGVTYSELNAMANRLAHAIVAERGTEPEAIAILLENGPRLMAAMLAVLKAGKFFVLLDLSSPKARLSAVLKDSEAALMISDRYDWERVRQENRAAPNLLEFDAISAGAAEKNLGLAISPDSLAAVVYTSGSTGEPKGVMRAHRNLLHQTMLFANAYKLSASDRLLLTSSSTANALTIGFLALLTGAVLLPFDVHSQGIRMLIRWIVEEQITICWMGSPLFRNMCQALTGKEMFYDVRIVRLSSELSFKSDIELYKQYFSPKCQLINGLSNTEAGLLCLYPIDHDMEFRCQDVPVGYPVEDKEIFLLDDSGKEVGANSVGEIAVKSRYLSPGYWRRPELTEYKFQGDPSSGDQRVYLTGDLGLMLSDGSLIHKGRKDFRVKIRGYGVELAEIEKALNGHAAVAQAVVVARKKENGEAKLIAYYCCTVSPAPTVSDFRGFLKKQLPDYMIPSTFVRLDEMPLTKNGKIDRRALPDPDNVRPDLASPYVSSRNGIEQRLIAIWEDVLDVRPVGVNDVFFELGGDSLSATRVISQVIKYFQFEIPLQLLFQTPTIADMAAVIAKRQGELTEDDKAIHGTAASLVHKFPEGSLPLSYSQQRLWFLDQLYPGSSTYNLFSAYRFKGELNVAALEKSFNAIIRRHEILRTVFNAEHGNSAQFVLPIFTIKIPILDLRALVSDQDRWAEARRIFTEEAQRPFDLATGPLLRITLLQLAEDEYVLLRAMHHIVFDGWSEGVLLRELAEIYAALTSDEPSRLADLPAQYADYSKWQRRWFDGARVESQLSYWKKQLANIATLQLPTDYSRPDNQITRGGRRYFVLSDALSSELKNLSRQCGATLFMTLAAAFQTLLHRYSGQTDIAIGSAVAGRSREEFEQLIGLFVNMLVLRLDLSGNPTFAETISRARKVCLEAFSHQELPFEKLVEELHPDRTLGHNPLFRATFAFQNTPRFSPQLSAIRVDELEVETGIARFDLHLFMEEVDGHLKGYCDYDANLFSADTIERMLGHLKTLLQGIVVNPEQPISELPLLTEREKHQILTEWNHIATEYPKDHLIHELFEAQVEKFSESVAVVFENQQLTYRELSNRANGLAHCLRKLGVGPEILVGICVERSLEMIVGILAILKAGGAYLPLDPRYPEERLAFMLEDSRAPVLITQSSLIERLPTRNATVFCLDRDWGEISTEEQDNPPPLTTPDNLAYVIYTSGSTGRPKGVQVPHYAVINVLTHVREALGLTEQDTVPLLANICFDISVMELLLPLVAGARLVVVSPKGAVDGERIKKMLSDCKVTMMHATPATWRLLLQAGWSGATNLAILSGGEALQRELAARLVTKGSSLWNLYGPTETTIYSSAAAYRPEFNGAMVSIGRPIANTQIYILDDHLQPLPIGAAGQLYIGGDGLTRGYLNRADLTGNCFLPNSFSKEPGARLYKTGDLARYRSDGNIEFLGRIDHQVKVRGFRIELGEIEAVLGEHSKVFQSVVLAREDAFGDKRLVAYVVASDRAAAAANELRAYLKEKLPEYMVPSAFVFLESLPFTPNGKLDRNGLPAPDQNSSESAEAYIAPRTPVEEMIADIWAEVLKLEKIGIYDNFFDLGGHSLLATQVMSRLRAGLPTDLSLRVLFEAPTVAELASRVEQSISEAGELEEFARNMAEVEALPEEEIERQLFKKNNAEAK